MHQKVTHLNTTNSVTCHASAFVFVSELHCYVEMKLKRKKDDSVVATSLSWSKSICNSKSICILERGITRIREPRRQIPPLHSKLNPLNVWGQAGLTYLP